ncbi:uncharacterized protein LTR77_002094 [Saxophila tyrrhenica]|uniref:Uncharacterized protein n=1 Tax=Saxophila tyrrhenica TaxID=1690608 RepID=A0AAV9PL37_9PEZI|nr:hypothetical protein LTR77_002094 [Saxophila tyrrhenica]
MPAFAALTSDEARERKAESSRPGTFAVVVTPESFSELPEYAGTSSPESRRGSVQSSVSSLAAHVSSAGRASGRSQTDPNVVVLDRFEDIPLPPAGFYSSPTDARRPSLPDRIQYLSIDTRRPSMPQNLLSSPQSTQMIAMDDPFVSHFRRYVLPRLVQPRLEETSKDLSISRTRDIFEIEARRFAPLHQAICALSALNLSYNGAASVDAAHSHYGRALQPQTATTSQDELLSNGAFLRHFLLFIYDVCIPMQHDKGAANMWAIHLDHLQRIAVLRHDTLGPERHGYLLWAICELDVYACLLGSGDCSFVRTLLQHQMMPGLDQQIPQPASSTGPFFPNEVQVFPPILALRHGVMMRLAKIAQTAQTFRREATNPSGVSPGAYARWQSIASQLQAELASFWQQAYPPFLPPSSPTSAHDLSPRPRQIHDQAFLLHHLATLYLRTSMFPRQRSLPLSNQHELQTDTETRVSSILASATLQLQARQLERRDVIFPLFIAGYATTQPDLKIQALDLMKAFEGQGVGQNTFTTRRLLGAVYEEQRRRVEGGGRMEEVEWMRVARERGLGVVNCGL